MPIPNHCIECDKPTMNIICDKCKEKEMEEQPKSPEAERPVDEELMSNCCTAPFTYPGWPDSDFCSQCHEHAGIDEDDSWDNNPDDGSWKGR